MHQAIINTTDYTVAQLSFFAAGCLLWIVVYFATIRNIVKKQFIEVPFITVCGNIAWEFLWSWIFLTNMGSLFVWGYRVWFFMDCFIVYGLLRYGYKQLSIPALQKRSVAVIALSIAAWFFMLYFYIKNYDAPISKMGAYSGFILNLLISGLYITQFLRLNKKALFSATSAWAKGLGTGFISVFCFLHFNDWFLLSMCLVNTVLDVVYIYLYFNASATAQPNELPVNTATVL